MLNDVRAFHGTITGFGSDDVLDIAGVQATNPSWGGGVLTLDTPFGQIFLNIAGPYSRTSFSVQSDGLGGTFVSGGYGDVHIVSLDGFAYDFQAVGEYVAARGNAGGTPWQVQILTDGHHGTASWTIGLAAQFGDTAVIFEVGKPITLHVEGASDTVLAPNANHAFSGGTLTAVSADTWRVAWNSGEVITVSEHGISLDWQVSAHDPNSVQGLLGPNSAPWSYLNLPDGTMHAPSLEQRPDRRRLRRRLARGGLAVRAPPFAAVSQGRFFMVKASAARPRCSCDHSTGAAIGKPGRARGEKAAIAAAPGLL